MAHIDELRLTFKDIYPLFIGISETWLHDSISDSEIELSDYSVHRHDRKNRRGGGVAIHVLENVKHTVRRDLEDDFEAIWIEMQLNKVKYLIGCVYKAPDESLEVFNYLDDVMRDATKNNLEVIVIGDLNCDILNTSRQTERLLKFTIVNQLEQLIKEPTRVTSTTSTLIDVLITSTLRLFKKAGAISISFQRPLSRLRCYAWLSDSPGQTSDHNNALLERQKCK